MKVQDQHGVAPDPSGLNMPKGAIILCRHHDVPGLHNWVLATVTIPPQDHSPKWLSAIPIGTEREESFRGDECVSLGHTNDLAGKVFAIQLRNGQKPLFCRVTQQPALVFPEQFADRFEDITVETYVPPQNFRFDPARDAIWPKEWPERIEELQQRMLEAENSVDGYVLHTYQMWEAELKWRLGLDKPFDPFDL
jgi:hypothetical protein